MNIRFASTLMSAALLAACPVVFDDSAPPAGQPGRVALTRSTPELPGAHCEHGGARLEHGVDDDGDGILADDEVDGSPAFVCDGAPAEVVRAMLVEVDDAPQSDCEVGGTRVRIGSDEDGDATLGDEEVGEQAIICNGPTGGAGDKGLVRVSPEPAGASCPVGGQRIDAGLDSDDDAVLDEDEIALTRFVCDGLDGPSGAAGSDAPLALVRVVAEPPGASCSEGGQRVETGVDEDGDAALDSAEVEGVAYVCDAQGEGVVLGAGRVEGTAAAPVVIPLDPASARLSTVAALSGSYYSFTSAAGVAPYVLEILGEDSPLTVRLFDDATLATERALTCTREGAALRCATPALPPDTTFLVTVTETLEVANAYGLRVSLGTDMGASDDPLPLTDDAGASLSIRASVGRAGVSTFDFTVPSAEAYTLALGGMVSSGTDGFSWRIEDAEGVHVSCPEATAPCSTGYLLAGTRYRLIVETTHLGAAFDVTLTEGDAITPVMPLDELVTLSDLTLPEARVFQFRTTSSTTYTFRSYAFYGVRYLTIYDAPPNTDGRHAYDVLDDPAVDDSAWWIGTDFDGHVTFLAPDRVYYFAIADQDDTANDPLFHLASRGGNETVVPIEVGTPYAGSLAGSSSYRFTTGASSSRYTITLERPLPAHNTILDVALWDVAADQGLAYLETPTFARQEDNIILVTPELPAAAEMELRVFTYTDTVYLLDVEEGDTISAALVVDSPVVVTLPAGGVAYYSVDAAIPVARTLSVTGGHALVLSSDSWPESIGDSGDTLDTSFTCQGMSCSGDLVLPLGRTFVTVENPLTVEQTFTVTLSSAADPIVLDAVRAIDLRGREAARFWYENDADVAHRVTIMNPENMGFRFRLRRSTDFGIEYESTRTTGSPTYYLPTGSISGTLPAGAWILEVDGDQSYNEYPLTVLLFRP